MKILIVKLTKSKLWAVVGLPISINYLISIYIPYTPLYTPTFTIQRVTQGQTGARAAHPFGENNTRKKMP